MDGSFIGSPGLSNILPMHIGPFTTTKVDVSLTVGTPLDIDIGVSGSWGVILSYGNIMTGVAFIIQDGIPRIGGVAGDGAYGQRGDLGLAQLSWNNTTLSITLYESQTGIDSYARRSTLLCYIFE